MPLQIQYGSSHLPAWLNDLYRGIAARARDLSTAPYVPYPGQRHARLYPNMDREREEAAQAGFPMPTHLERAAELGEQTGQYLPYLERASHFSEQGAQEFTAPGVREQYMDPYIHNVIRDLEREGGRTLERHIMPALDRRFGFGGNSGSLRHRESAQEAARDMQRNIQSSINQALHAGHGEAVRTHAADRARMLQAAEQQRELGRARQAGHVADISALQDIGERYHGHEQERLNTAHQDWQQRMGYPMSQLREQVGVMSGVPNQQTTYGATQNPAPYQWNRAGQMGNLAAALYGMNRAGGQGYRKGGAVKPKFPKFPKMGAHGSKKIGSQSLTQTSFIRHPKVGAKHGMGKARHKAKGIF